MAKLYFYYAAMNAGKSTTLLQSSFNYRERGMNTMLFTSALDERFGKDAITSRIGVKADAHTFDDTTDMFAYIESRAAAEGTNCVFIDEAHFLSRPQVLALTRVADELGIPILCYGLRTDFQGQLFEGSSALLALSDELNELKTICDCGRKAIMNLRLDENGEAVKEGAQTDIGGNDKYIALCRRHFMQKVGSIT